MAQSFSAAAASHKQGFFCLLSVGCFLAASELRRSIVGFFVVVYLLFVAVCWLLFLLVCCFFLQRRSLAGASLDICLLLAVGLRKRCHDAWIVSTRDRYVELHSSLRNSRPSVINERLLCPADCAALDMLR